jgi:hypothetical protein
MAHRRKGEDLFHRLPKDSPLDRSLVIGEAELTRRAYQRGNLRAEWAEMSARTDADPYDAAAWLDMSVILLAAGERRIALNVQAMALKLRRVFRVKFGNGDGPRVLAFMVAGDLMANTPVDFLLTGSDAELWLVFVDAIDDEWDDLPEHDVAVVAIGQSGANAPVLEKLARRLANWPAPVINGAPMRIAGLSRDGVCAALAEEPSILAPTTRRLSRETLFDIAAGNAELDRVMAGCRYPIILRPLDSHAGHGMEKIDDGDSIRTYLERHPDPEFFAVPFVDYSGADGFYRKQRVAFINGLAFPSHLAVSSHWMVHYLNAGMSESAEKRAEEAAWMRDFDDDFARRHAAAFDALHRRFGLDYFVIDCAEMPDGRLLLFEADIAMIVHDMDSQSVFPYKRPAMERLFASYQRALQERMDRAAGRGGAVCAHTGLAAVYQRTPDDCMICVLAMLIGRSYEEIVEAACRIAPGFPRGGPMSHSIFRHVAKHFGFALLSGIFVAWDKPGIVGVLSPTSLDTGHAVLWDGTKIIDPGSSWRVDRRYVELHGLEFTQEAQALRPLIEMSKS